MFINNNLCKKIKPIIQQRFATQIQLFFLLHKYPTDGKPHLTLKFFCPRKEPSFLMMGLIGIVFRFVITPVGKHTKRYSLAFFFSALTVRFLTRRFIGEYDQTLGEYFILMFFTTFFLIFFFIAEHTPVHFKNSLNYT